MRAGVLAVVAAALAIAVPAYADDTTTTTDTTTTVETVTTTPATTETAPATTTAPAPVRYGTVEQGMPLPRALLKRRTHKLHQPLTVTPPLGQRGYVFPVAGSVSFTDTYGALRVDIHTHWHHGDDLFAALGTPVVAVAAGSVSRVGWNRLGGWGLWLRDDRGNEFYYAHLSGYAPAVMHSSAVRAGEVVGFVGNTGDAITASPHLHFEIHPHSLLHLQYDGAVDPTRYLDRWTHTHVVHPPRPVYPRLPAGASGVEARRVFRELLAARHLIRHARPAPRHLAAHLRVHVASLVAAVPAPPLPHRRISPLVIAILMGLGALGAYGIGVAFRSFRTYSVLVSVARAIAREAGMPATERTLTFDGAAPQPDAMPTPIAIDCTKPDAERAV